MSSGGAVDEPTGALRSAVAELNRSLGGDRDSSPLLQSGSRGPGRVLVVDDESMIREILADFLAMEGFTVRTAPDGLSALEAIDEEPVELILTDLKMPRLDGLGLLAAVRERSCQTLVTIMTGFGTVETAIDAMKRGAYDYILKPFKMEDVVHTIRRGLETQRLQAENLRLKEALSLYRVSETIASSLSLDEVLQAATGAAVHEMGADAAFVLLDDGGGVLRERSRQVSELLARAGGAGHGFSVGELQGRQLETLWSEPRPIRVHGAECLPYFASPPSIMPQSLVITGLKTSTARIGFLCALSVTPGRLFDEGQRKLLSIVANRAAAAIENARLYENLKRTIQQTISGLASAVDKMDPYTAGHSERVSIYAERLAQKAALHATEVEIIRQSALMHDIGKIGCVVNLNKPGKLTSAEYEEFKKHPAYGREILSPVTFLHNLVPGVFLHHERWQGGGYPTAVAAKDIPLMARIICVADSYDAMTSDRAYRKALPHGVAMEEIERCSGTQFDPDMARLFVEAIDELREEHGGDVYITGVHRTVKPPPAADFVVIDREREIAAGDDEAEALVALASRGAH